MYSAQELEIDAQTFVAKLPPDVSRWCKIALPDQLKLSEYQKAAIFLYTEPKDLRVAFLGKNGEVTSVSEKSVEGSVYNSAAHLRMLVDTVCRSPLPFQAILIDQEALLDPRFPGGMYDQQKLARVRPLIDDSMTFEGTTAWIKDGQMFAQDELGKIQDEQGLQRLLTVRVQQMDSDIFLHDDQDFVGRLKSTVELMREKQTAMNVPKNAKERAAEQHNRMMVVLEDIVRCDPSNLLFKRKKALFTAAMDELDGYGPLGPIMRGSQGHEHPVEMHSDGTFWYGKEKLKVEFFDEAHRKDVLHRLGKPERTTQDGFAEFPIDIIVWDEDKDDEYRTVRQWLRIPQALVK